MKNKQVDIGILTVIPAELEATLAVLGMNDVLPEKDQDGTNYWFGHIQSLRKRRDYSVALGIIGGAGNNNAAAAATALIKDFSPKILLLVGIAAGIKGKIKIGEVVLSERVVAYESGVLEKKKDEETFIPRPEMARIAHAVEQDVMSYFPKEEGLRDSYAKAGGAYPTPRTGQEEEFEKYVATTISVRTATVASGEKLLKNPDKLISLRSGMHGRIEVGEMEAAGVESACRRLSTNWLVVRGVSDFGDELKSDEFHKFAAKAAAVVLADFVRQGLDLDYAEAKTLAPAVQDEGYPHIDDLLVQVSRLIHPASEASKFNLRVSLAHSFDDILGDRFLEGDANLTPKEVLERTHYRRLLIHSPGGSGKTAVMCEIAQEAIANGQVVFFLDLKTGSSAETLPENFTVDNLFDSFSVAGNVGDFHRALDQEDEALLLVDGLNEVYGIMSETILKLLERLLLAHSKLRVIVADRMNPHPDIRYIRGSVIPLDESEVVRLLPEGAKLPDEPAEKQLLSNPFFLDLQLSLWCNIGGSSVSPQSVLARGEMFKRYFTEIAKVDESDLPELAEAAYKAYEEYQGRTFESEWWVANTPHDVAARLEEAGITVATAAAGERKKMFRHQLLHDFLTGYYVAGLGEEGWGSKIFDAATFKSNAAEPLSFAAELLKAQADDFLVQVYDWSYRIVDRCIVDLRRSLVRSPVSKDLEVALAVKNAEKVFDIFEYTALASKRSLQDTSIPEAKTLVSANTMDDVLDFVRAFVPSTPRFRAWKDLFLLPSETKIEEAQLLLLDGDPIIGWTAANTFRRISLSDSNTAQVRIMYHIALKNDDDTLRWRIAHLLGKYPNSENQQLLLKVILSDPYEWARYGAIRSLMEIAYKTGGSTRTEIISSLLSDLPNIKSSLTVREIRRTCLVCNADPAWYEAIRGLAVEAAKLPEAEIEREAWNELLEEIDRRRAA